MLRLYKEQDVLVGRMVVGMLCLILLFVPLASCATPAPDPFTSLNLGIPAGALTSPVTGSLPDATILHMRITFKLDPRLLSQTEKQPVQPGQPSNIEKFASKLGVSDATYQKIKAFFNTQGIAINLSKLRTHLAIDAKAGKLAKLLQTKFVTHNDNGHAFYAPDKAPQVPTFLANSIDAVTGLDNYSSPPLHSLTMSPQNAGTLGTAAQDCSPEDQTLLPREIAGAYGYDQLWNQGLHGENMTVNLVEIDGSYSSDIQNYSSCVNFQGKVQTHNIDGKPREALGESTLDIQMVMGLARSANINVYQTDGSDPDADVWVNVNDMLQQIINDNVNNANSGNVVSISLGAAEREMTQDDVQALNSSFEQLTRVLHMTVFVASGDCGAFTDRRYGDLSVSFPASSTSVVTVGGTILQVDSNRTRANEVVWSDGSQRSKCTNQWGSGGGNSQLFKRPSWQNAPGVSNHYAQGARQLPDVSAAAYALAVYFNGQWGAVGGTSAAAPIWAAGMILINQGQLKQRHAIAYSPQIFYDVANKKGGEHPYFDVTSGNNLYYPASSGWDYASGLGTPNLADFYRVVQSINR